METVKSKLSAHTHRCHFCEDVLAAQVRAGKCGHHCDNVVEYGDDHGFHGPNWRRGVGEEGEEMSAFADKTCLP